MARRDPRPNLKKRLHAFIPFCKICFQNPRRKGDTLAKGGRKFPRGECGVSLESGGGRST
jgi:hypothetical protein